MLEIHKDHIIIGVREEFKRGLAGLTPLKKKDGTQVYKGEILTSGALDIREYKKIIGDLEAQKYIIKEINKVYA